MKPTIWTLTWVTVMGSALPVFASDAENSPQTNIPALLQFAEQYQNDSDKHKLKQTTQQPRNTSVTAHGHKQRALPAAQDLNLRPGNWRMKDTEIQKQREKIAGLEHEVSALQLMLKQQKTAGTAQAPDIKGLTEFATRVRQALAITPEEKLATESVRQANIKASAALKAEQALQTQLDTLKLRNEMLQQNLATLQAQSETQLKESDAARRKTDETNKQQLAKLQLELAAAKVNQPEPLTSDSLNSASAKQNYAAGVSLGEEILQMQVERNRWGVNTDKQLILAGIVDTFSGKRRLTDEVLNHALTAAEKEVTTAREKTLSAQVKTGNAYLEKFKQQKGVKLAPDGFWYKIDYTGDAPLASGAIVDVVVKEMLTDGTVIQDMEANGAVLSQKVTDFPPLFQQALGNLRNHGSMTMVVPPALAYGEKGYPPKVPPEATMVYQLRVAEMYPAGKKTSSSKK